MKKKILTLLLIILMFNLVGCAKCMNTEYENVEVFVVDKFHRSMWMQPIHSGDMTTFIAHPEVCKIYVEYDGMQYSISDKDTYYEYEDMIGQTAVGKLEIKTYNDGTIEHNIVALE